MSIAPAHAPRRLPPRRAGRSRRVVPALIWLCTALLFGTLLVDELLRLERNTLAIAGGRGEALFSLIQHAREWNARHGRVYVPVTETMRPNEHLRHPQRDVTTTTGEQLTLVNPAFMTRQIGEISTVDDAVRLHITSLQPLRQENLADDWEKAALERFEQGQQAQLALLRDEQGAAVYRYMAPLRVTEPCLQCHAEHGYREGDIRGGISVTMPAASLLSLQQAQQRRVIAAFVLAFLGAAGLLHYLYRVLLRHLSFIEHVNAEQEALIAKRTAQLQVSNAELAREVARRAAQQQALAESEARYRAMFDSAGEGVALLDSELRLLRVNPAFALITGYGEDELQGRALETLGAGRQEAGFFDDLRARLEREGRWQGEVWNRRKSGDAYVQWMSLARSSPNGADAAYVMVVSDITVRKEAELRMQYRAHHDPLTDLPNRALFEDRLAAALARAQRSEERFGLLFLDIDRFKPVNDRLGHPAGDALLIEASRRISACARASDTVARLGGDEFAVIVTRAGRLDDVVEVATRICATMAATFVLPQGEASVAASVGIALWPEHGQDAASLQDHADQALYVAKRAGGNRWHLYVAGEADGQSVRART